MQISFFFFFFIIIPNWIRITSCFWYYLKVGNFNLEDDNRSDAPKKFDNAELEELLNENPIQTQEKSAERLGVIKRNETTISIQLKQLDKIQKLERWVLHELNEMNKKKNRFEISAALLSRHKRKSFLHKIIIGDVKDLIWQSQMMEIINPRERFM